ncbi:MAG: hypothetical protein Q9160_003568 [Pyrenula sp. 1 TL-2023]
MGCKKCTSAFCDQPTKKFRDQSTCNCGPCKGSKKPDPNTNDRCIPDCTGQEAAVGPKDTDGDATCQKCPQGKKPDADHSDCVDGTDNNNKCPTGSVPNGPDKPDGTPNCKECPGKKVDTSGTKCADDDENCRPGQKKVNGQCVTDKDKKDKAMSGNLDRYKKKWQDDAKKKEDDDRKKAQRGRGGKCLLVVDLILAPAILNEITKPVEGSDMYDFSTGAFDQGFVDQDWQFDWPSDVEWKPDVNVDDPKFMQPWFDYVAKMQEARRPEICNCGSCYTKRHAESVNAYHAKHKRCPPKIKRDLTGDLIAVDHDDPMGITVTYGSNPHHPSLSPRSDEDDFVPDPNDPDGHHQSVTGVNPHKRQFQFLIPIFDLIMAFARGAMSFIGRAVAAAGRIAQAFKNGEKVLKVVKDGSKYTRDMMKNAAQKIRENKNFNQCLQGLSPV